MSAGPTPPPILDYNTPGREPPLQRTASPVWAAIAIPIYGLVSFGLWWGFLLTLIEREGCAGMVVGTLAIFTTWRLWAAVRYALGAPRLWSRESFRPTDSER